MRTGAADAVRSIAKNDRTEERTTGARTCLICAPLWPYCVPACCALEATGLVLPL